MNINFELTEVAGFRSAMKGMRFPTKSKGDTVNKTTSNPREANIVAGEKDISLGMRLISRKEDFGEDKVYYGDVHGKFQRGITAWFDINMPRCIWSEIDTYSVGVDMISSESTMYTLIKECADITPEMFVDYTPEFVIDSFRNIVSLLSEQYGGRKHIPINIIKSALPEGWLQRRERGFSYQTLKNMYIGRRHHRMPEWGYICDEIEKLPYFEEFIIGKYL